MPSLIPPLTRAVQPRCFLFVKPLLAAVGISCLCAGGGTIRAQQQTSTPSATRRNVILFVGNSFTHGKSPLVRRYNNSEVTDENAKSPAHTGDGGIPGIFKKLTSEAGLDYEVHIEAVDAKDLGFHYQKKLPILQQSRWTVVVLQEHSTGPLPAARSGRAGVAAHSEDEPGDVKPPGSSPAADAMPAKVEKAPSKMENFAKNAALIEQAVHTAAPAAKLYLYATWPRADLTYPKGAMYAGEPIDAMGRDLHDGFYRVYAEEGRFAGVAPVGDAWLRAIHAGVAQENPYVTADQGKLDLWSTDNHHPSASGAYLAALVLFQQITGRDARTLGKTEQAAATLGISPEDAARLQLVAFEQVTAQPVSGGR